MSSISSKPKNRRDANPVRLAVVLVLAATVGSACTSSRPATTARRSPRTASRVGFGSGARRAVAARYLLIAREGNRRLEIDFDGLEEDDRGDLAAARADLLDAAATERRFDRRLLAISFPPELGAVARTLYSVNEDRARLTLRAAASTSLHELRAYEPQLDAANDPVERQVRIIRRRLGLPPPETS